MTSHATSSLQLFRLPAISSAAFGLTLALALPAQQQPPQFVELAGHELASLSAVERQVLAQADVDGDHDLDVVVGSSTGCHLLTNDGYGHFTEVAFPQFTGVVSALASGDVDGDGHADLLVGTGGVFSGHVRASDRLYLNDGQGRFTDATSTHLPAQLTRTDLLVLGDLDGDGDLDAVTHDSSSHTQLLWNDGSGRFTSGATWQASGWLDELLLGDLDGDGDLDLIVPGSILRNDGSRQFTDVTSTAVPAGHVTAMAIADLDGDGDLDLLELFLVGRFGAELRVLQNDGRGVFTLNSQLPSHPTGRRLLGVSLGDVDGDGDVDALVSWIGGFPWTGHEQFRDLLLNDGQGHMVERSSRLIPIDNGELLGGELLGDFDGDQDLDILNCKYTYGPSGDRKFVSLETNVQRQLDIPAPPQVGQPWSIDAWMRYGPSSVSDLALPFVALAPAAIPLGGLGTLGIDPGTAVALPTIQVSPASGRGSLQLQVPADPTLSGSTFYLQALLVPYPQAPRLSNVVPVTIQ